MTASTLSPDTAADRGSPPGARPLRRPVPPAAPAGRPRWAVPALIALLVGTAVLYLWDLGASGTANSFYAAAVQAGTKSWKALLFGSLDSSNFITVDKPPAALWVMALSGRIFGFNSWSMLVPQAIEGVAAVGLLYAAVRRWFGDGAGLLAGAGLALTPVAALMFRFNNPDALLVLLLVGAAYALVRAVEAGSTRWMLLVGTALGFAFLTKMMQAFLVLPAFALVYLVAAPTPVRRRIVQLLLGGLAIVVSAGWYVALVELWPAGSRPYIGGSTDNSLLQLVFGYNGLSRLTGGSGNGGGGNNSSFGGATGLGRLFGSSMGTQISWLLPAALLALVLGFWLSGRAPRTDRLRAALVLWGGWLLVTGLTFSFMQGTIHPYYTVALAPAISALVAIVGSRLWAARSALAARAGLAALIAVTAVWSWVLLGRSDWQPWLRVVVLIVGLLGAAAVLALRTSWRRSAVLVTLVAVLAASGGSTAYAVVTAGTAHNGSTPTAGPAGTSGGMGGFGGTGSAPGGTRSGRMPSGSGGPGGSSSTTGAPSGTSSPGSTSSGSTSPGTAPTMPGSGSTQSGERPTGSAGMGGTASTSTALASLLKNAGTRWAAASVGSQTAASLELSTGTAIMAIGGFTGSDPAPTLAQFKAYVAAGEVHYFLASGGGAGGGQGSSTSSQITSWVESHFTEKTVGGTTVYDLTSPKS